MSRNPLIGSIFALLAGSFWSLGSLAVRLAQGADPFQYLTIRGIGALILMEAVAVANGRGILLPRFLRATPVDFVAAVSMMAAAIFFILSLRLTTVADAVFFSSTSPLQTAVMARLVLGERIGRAGLVAIAIGVAGLLVMIGGDIGGGSLMGNIFAFASATCFAVYAVALRAAPGRDWSVAMSGYGFLTFAVCLAFTLAAGRSPVVPAFDAGLALAHGIVLIGVGNLFFLQASRQVSAVGLTVLAQSETVLAPIWVYLALGERPSLTTLAGGALILAAIVLQALAGRPEPGGVRDGEPAAGLARSRE
jgi:drug/metabolite transporter (DMT)-like permease